MLIARLIADPDKVETRLDGALDAIKAQGMSAAMVRMLEHEGDVLQISLADGDAAQLRPIIEEHFAPVAALIGAEEPQIPRVFVSDMDSTMIGQECIDELADFAGLKDRVAEITERAMQGELDFESALRERVGLLAGLEEAAIDRCLAERIRPIAGAKTLVQTLRAARCRTALVTGGFHHFADAVAAELGFDRVVGNRLAVEGGKLTGGLAGPIADSATKLAVLREEQSQAGTGTILATGDGANDIPMLDAADYGFAFVAKPKARAAANGWVDAAPLTAILRLLDIPQSQWVG